MNIFFKNKNYRKFTIASWLSNAGDILFYLALMTYASNLKNYALALSLISISEAIPRLIQSISGYFADRTRNKFKTIILLAIIRFVLYTIVGVLFASNIAGWNLVVIVVIINFISDISGMYSSGLKTPLIVDLVGKEQMSEAEGFNNGISQIITMTAQFVGSGLLLFMSYSTLAIVNALTFLLAGIIFANIAFNYKKQNTATTDLAVNNQSFFATISSSFKQVRKAHGLLTVVSVIALLNGILSTIEPLMSIVIAGNKNAMVIGTYSFTIALIGTIAAAGVAVGSAIGVTIFKNVSLFVIALLDTVASIFMIFSLLNRNIIGSLIGYAFLGFFAGISGPKLSQWLVSSVDRTVLSSSIGMLNTILTIIGPLMNFIFSSIAGTGRVNYALYGVILLSIIILFVTLYVMKKIKSPL